MIGFEIAKLEARKGMPVRLGDEPADLVGGLERPEAGDCGWIGRVSHSFSAIPMKSRIVRSIVQAWRRAASISSAGTLGCKNARISPVNCQGID
jgi:hypothetical protein